MSASSRSIHEQGNDARTEVISVPAKEELLPILISDIGKQYLVEHPRGITNIAKNLFNSNQDIADKMAEYKPDASVTMDAHEIFLVNRYLDLPNYTGTLASKIRDLYKHYFLQDLSPDFLIKRIATETLQEIGIDYLNKHPTPSPWYSLIKHNNQEQAGMLKGCVIVDPETQQHVRATRPIDLWHCLLSVYGLLPNHNGDIACAIENKVSNVFGIKFEKVDAMGGQSQNLTTSQTAERARPLMSKKIHDAYKPTSLSIEMQETKIENRNGLR
jgi:hypothetical protein